MTDSDHLQLATYTDDDAPAHWIPSLTPHLFLTDSAHPQNSPTTEDAVATLLYETHEAGCDLSLLSPHAHDLTTHKPHLTRRTARIAATGNDMRARVEATHAEMMRRHTNLDEHPDSRPHDFPPLMLLLADLGDVLTGIRREGNTAVTDDAPAQAAQHQLVQLLHLGGAARTHLILVGDPDTFMSWFSASDRGNVRARVLLGDPCDKEIGAVFEGATAAPHHGSPRPHGLADLGDGPRPIVPHLRDRHSSMTDSARPAGADLPQQAAANLQVTTHQMASQRTLADRVVPTDG